jgi:Domain of unknown function (DUF222)
MDVIPTHPRLVELERLGDEIAELSAHLDAASARLLELIREFDARDGWNDGACRSCAHWLAWRTGTDLNAARERVRVARALGSLPRISAALARGEISYAKARALTRAATPETEEQLLAFARAGTAHHVERLVRAWRRVDLKAETDEAARQHRSRALHVYQDADGTVVIRGRLTAEVGALVMQALAAARDTLHQRARLRDPIGTHPAWSNSKPTPWGSWPRAPCTTASSPGRRPSDTRSWSTLMLRHSRTLPSPDSPYSKAAHTLPR